jgi:hypothetical protein
MRDWRSRSPLPVWRPWFKSFHEVPERTMTLTIPGLFRVPNASDLWHDLEKQELFGGRSKSRSQLTAQPPFSKLIRTYRSI